jgi:two-component system OmpR family sensor kinase
MVRYDFVNGSRQFQTYAQVGIHLDRHDRQLRELAFTLAAVGVSVWFIAMVVAALLIRHWLHALTSLKLAAAQLRLNKLSKQRVLVPPGDEEIAGLVGTLNQLLDHLESAHTTQQRFVADASHELRTPLTILRGEIEVALRKPRSADEYREVLQSNKEEIESLSRLTENLLLLARADAGQSIALYEEVRLAQVATDVCAKLQASADRRGASFDCNLEQSVAVRGDRVALERILFNLIDNAVSYSPAGEKIGISVRQEGDQAVIEVSDAGPGIAAEQLPHLFDRFYRADRSRSREHEGAGLGLAIVKAFVEAHQGTVEVTSEVGHGAQFVVRIPVA